MILTVSERGQFVATMRYVNVWLMETLATWVPTSPEMEVKLLFGEQIWDVAQHADALGKRTFELRMPLQHSSQPSESYVALLAAIRPIAATHERLASVYDVVLPGLAKRYQHYLEKTDALADAPTVRILERHLMDMGRMGAAGRKIREDLPALRMNDPSWGQALAERESTIEIRAGTAVAERTGA